MKPTVIRSEQGQVLILIVLSIVALLGFAALAIDGGMIFSERRVAQNAADAAAYAGAASLSQTVKNLNPGDVVCAEFNKKSGDVEENTQKIKWNTTNRKNTIANAAIARADDNTFTVRFEETPANITAADNAVWMECGFDNTLKMTYLDVRVRLTRQVSTSLMHLFYNGPAVNTVDSTVRVYPPAGVVIDTVILALCNSGTTGTKDGLFLGGSTNITIVEGKMVSNCKINSNGSKAKYNVPDGINYSTGNGVDEFKAANLVSPTTVSYADPLAFPYSFSDILKARCAAYTTTNDINVKTKVITNITPGKYSNIKMSKGSLKMAPGLYCVTGSIDINSSDTLISVGGTNYSFYGKDVTIYMPDTASSLTINGSATSLLSAPTEECFQSGQPCSLIANGPPVKGLAIWYDAVGDTITLNGSSTSVFDGTLAAPYSLVRLLGSNSTTDVANFGVQVIGDDVEISGNSEVDVTYNAKKLFSTDAQMGLQR